MNDPLGAVVAHTVIQVIRDEGLIERGRQMTVRLVDGLAGILAKGELKKQAVCHPRACGDP